MTTADALFLLSMGTIAFTGLEEAKEEAHEEACIHPEKRVTRRDEGIWEWDSSVMSPCGSATLQPTQLLLQAPSLGLVPPSWI